MKKIYLATAILGLLSIGVVLLSAHATNDSESELLEIIDSLEQENALLVQELEDEKTHTKEIVKQHLQDFFDKRDADNALNYIYAHNIDQSIKDKAHEIATRNTGEQFLISRGLD